MEVEVFFDRHALAMAVRTLRAARDSIDLEMFMVGGRLGRAVLRVLDRKARSGVRVRLLHREGTTIRAAAACKRWLRLARNGQSGHPEYHYTPEVDRLFRAELATSPVVRRGFPLHRFRGAGFAPLKLAHDKIVVVDGATAIVGGMNLATAVARNCDLLVRLRGPAAALPAAVFEYDWKLAGGAEAAFPHWVASWSPAGRKGGANGDRLRMVVTRPGCSNQLDAVRELIGGARSSLLVQMFYLTDPVVVRDLVSARSRGVDVRVVCDANEFSLGVRLHGAPNLPFVEELLRGGVGVRLFSSRPGTQMHQKSLVVDSRLVFAGATNLTRQSFLSNTDSAIIVESPRLAGILGKRFERCWSRHAAEPNPEVFRRRRLYLHLVRAISRYV